MPLRAATDFLINNNQLVSTICPVAPPTANIGLSEMRQSLGCWERLPRPSINALPLSGAGTITVVGGLPRAAPRWDGFGLTAPLIGQQDLDGAWQCHCKRGPALVE